MLKKSLLIFLNKRDGIIAFTQPYVIILLSVTFFSDNLSDGSVMY
jgi:hypothetical protein